MRRVNRDQRATVSVTLNGRRLSAEAEPRMSLSDFIRHALGATGTHVGCEHGVCGACTVDIDGKPARSCLTLAVQIEGCEVRTVESLALSADHLGILQAAFKRNHALQCGFCTAGILMSLDCFLRENPRADEKAIRDLLTGHLCRCTGYTPLVRAALEAAAEMSGDVSREKSDA